VYSVESQLKFQSLPACYLLHSAFLLGLFFDPEDGGNMFIQNVGSLSTDYSVISKKMEIFKVKIFQQLLVKVSHNKF
jgi:hypothetical protein